MSLPVSCDVFYYHKGQKINVKIIILISIISILQQLLEPRIVPEIIPQGVQPQFVAVDTPETAIIQGFGQKVDR